MTMTELIGTLERAGWRFQTRDGRVLVNAPKPRPVNADEVLLEIARRRIEAVSFLKARAEADRLRELLGLPEIPVFQATPPPDAKLLPFPTEADTVRHPAPLRRRS